MLDQLRWVSGIQDRRSMPIPAPSLLAVGLDGSMQFLGIYTLIH